MNRRLVFTAAACLLAGAGFRGYSGPKTITVGEALNPPVPALSAGIPAEYGDLIAVDNGYLFFVDGDGTIRRVGLTRDGAPMGPVAVIPRK